MIKLIDILAYMKKVQSTLGRWRLELQTFLYEKDKGPVAVRTAHLDPATQESKQYFSCLK